MRTRWPLPAGLALYWTAVAVILWRSLQKNGGALVYPLDDTYIHMAIAKNAALHQVWGVTQHAFTSSTSSPLWTGLLAAVYAVAGVNDWAPLVLNLVFGTAAVVVADVLLKRLSVAPGRRFLLLAAATLAAPLPTMTIVGMEHALHALLTIAFVAASSSELADDGGAPRWSTTLLAPLVGAVRYEGLFVAAVVGALLAARGRRVRAAVVPALAAAPLVVYGLWSMAHGWGFLPNSVALKGVTPSVDLASILDHGGVRAIEQVVVEPTILVLVVASLALLLGAYLHGERRRDPRTYALAAFVGAALLHLQFARLGWFFRYEGYLVFLGITVVGASVDPLAALLKPARDARPGPAWTAAAVALLVVLAAPFARRAYRSAATTPQATTNIGEQQVQMARFLRAHYDGRAVVMNDVGAACWLSDIRVVDLWGLGTKSTGDAILADGELTTGRMASIAAAEGAAIAVVYDEAFVGASAVPARWTRVGRWRIANNVACSRDAVSFYAVDPLERFGLVANLRAFAAELPRTVEQSGPYTAP